jgi:hypothetical protein
MASDVLSGEEVGAQLGGSSYVMADEARCIIPY